ncbi:radical SAM protein, partial [Candidatus Bathyarchaeota archaeon]|nr:radical SAM protein [Candidatus Bathyarchaeota archaeon]
MQLIPNIFGTNEFGPAFYRLFLPWAIKHPRYLYSAAFLLRSYSKAFQQRKKSEQNGLKVPPALILSLTKQCNLSCSGCFAEASGITCNKSSKKNMSSQLDWKGWTKIISEARELGVFGFFLAGGEPFLYPKLLELCEAFRDRCFIIFTNGTTIKERDFEQLKHLSNIAIIVSVEGGKNVTNIRRGDGVYQKAINSLKHLSYIGTPNGISVTVTRNNYQYWMNNESIDSLIAHGIRVAVFIEYIPVLSDSDIGLSQNINSDFIKSSDHFLMLTKKERFAFR